MLRRLAGANARIGVAISEYHPRFSLGALLGSATAISSGNLFTTEAARAAIASFRALGGGWDARDPSSNSYSALQ